MSTLIYAEKPRLTAEPVDDKNDDKVVEAENGGRVVVSEVKIAEEA